MGSIGAPDRPAAGERGGRREIGRASCRESDWSSDVCSSDLDTAERSARSAARAAAGRPWPTAAASGRGAAEARPAEAEREASRPQALSGQERWVRSARLTGRPPESEEDAVRSEERRVGKVTGVQTCALPISTPPNAAPVPPPVQPQAVPGQPQQLPAEVRQKLDQLRQNEKRAGRRH